MHRKIDPDQIASLPDPIPALATQLVDIIMDTDDYVGACNRLVFREMGLHPKTQVGGDHTDKTDFYRRWMEDKDYTLLDLIENDSLKQEVPDYIEEDDPRFQLYYELLSTVTTHVLAQIISSNSFRWRQKVVNHHATLQAMGESNR